MLLLPSLWDSFLKALRQSPFMHRCNHKGAKCGRQGVTKPKNERHKCIIHAESLQCTGIPFFRADHTVISVGYMILYFWHLPLFLFYLGSKVTWVFIWHVCLGQISQQCWVTPQDFKGVAVTQVDTSCLMPSAPLSTAVSALSGTLLEKCIRGKER